METKNKTVPWIENYASGSHQDNNLLNVIILHDFELIEDDTDVTFKVFGSGNNRHVVISPKKESEGLNHVIARVQDNKVTDQKVLSIFKEIGVIRIDFVESEGVYYQIENY